MKPYFEHIIVFWLKFTFCKISIAKIGIIVLGFSFTACLSHYQRNIQFHQYFENGNLDQASSALQKDHKAAKSKARLLYYLNLGTVSSLQGKYEESNRYFEEAYRLGEGYNTNYLNEVLAYFTNPTMVEYRGEDFELLMLHYYKALNYLKMNDKASALVECKRMNLKLQKMSDRFSSDEKYQRDAFVHTLMGIIYEANGEINDAFIAYRNAVEIYKSDYKKMFNVDIPEQLKKDLMRTAYLLGFREELHQYENEFGMQYEAIKKEGGELVFLWNNGLGPVKTEWSVNFTPGFRNGNVIFANEEMNLNFPFPWEIRRDNQNNRIDALANLDFLRVAFPKYIPRNPYFEGAELRFQSNVQRFELLEDVNAVAQKSLRQRMVWEMGNGLLRVALKRTQVAALRKENEKGWAFLLNTFNNITEKADTRAWHTIPHSIYYTRMNLPVGNQQVEFVTYHNGNPKTQSFNFDIQKGQIMFHSFHSLETENRFQNPAMGWNRR
jgi:hypothetical protein